jgi:hypothetical protein
MDPLKGCYVATPLCRPVFPRTRCDARRVSRPYCFMHVIQMKFHNTEKHILMPRPISCLSRRRPLFNLAAGGKKPALEGQLLRCDVGRLQAGAVGPVQRRGGGMFAQGTQSPGAGQLTGDSVEQPTVVPCCRLTPPPALVIYYH